MSTIKEVGPQGVLPSGFSWDREFRCYRYCVKSDLDCVVVSHSRGSAWVRTCLEDVISAQTLGEFDRVTESPYSGKAMIDGDAIHQSLCEFSLDDDSAEMAAEVARQVAALKERARRVEILERMEEQDRADEAAADRFWKDRRDQWQNGTLGH